MSSLSLPRGGPLGNVKSQPPAWRASGQHANNNTNNTNANNNNDINTTANNNSKVTSNSNSNGSGTTTN